MISYKPDVDCEVRFVRNERACPIEGIDQKEFAFRLRNLARGNRFFCDDGNARRYFTQSLDDDDLGLVVSNSNGRGVGFGFSLNAGVEVTHLDPPGSQNYGKQCLKQSLVSIDCHAFKCPLIRHTPDP